MNNKLMVLGLLVFLGISLFPASDEVMVKVPVRVVNELADGYDCAKNLEQGDFELLISGVKTPIVEFYKKSRSIETCTQGRFIALSFEASEYGKKLEEATAHFVRETLKNSDLLLVRSPLHVYKIDASANKEEIIQYIEENVQKDTRRQQEEKNKALAGMEMLVKNIRKKLDAKKLGIRSVMLFVSHYSTQWNAYYSLFVSKRTANFLEIASRLAQADKNTEKWLFHFLQKNVITVPDGFSEIRKRLKKYIQALPSGTRDKAGILVKKLNEIEESMKTPKHFPMKELTNAFLGVNVSFNVISFESPVESKPGENSLENALDRETRKRFGMIAMRTGGISVAHPDLREAQEAIIKHVDTYYDLVFKLGGPVEDKNLKITVPSAGGTAYYKESFGRNEVKWLMDFMNKGSADAQLAVENFVLNQGKISFTVSGFRKSRSGEGMVKVDARLIDSNQETVYQTGNTLKSTDNEITITIKVPDKYSGYYKLSITTNDLISGQSAEFKQYIKIKK